MRYLKVCFICFLSLLFASKVFAIDEEMLKEKIRRNFESLMSRSKVQEPSQNISTRSPMGSKFYRAVSDGIVLIFTKDDKMGSGVVVSSSGLIITNWHVVEDNALVGAVFKKAGLRGTSSLKEEDIFFAKVLKVDVVRDLALLQIISPPQPLTVLKLGLLSQVDIGQDVFAISHPEGLLWSYTEGVISQIHSDYSLKSESGTHRATYIQTQAVISYGSSGGALFDYSGQLIGILVATLGPGLNFAIAVNDVRGFILSALEKR